MICMYTNVCTYTFTQKRLKTTLRQGRLASLRHREELLDSTHLIDPTTWGDMKTIEHPLKTYSAWWFGTFFIFAYIGNNHPN